MEKVYTIDGWVFTKTAEDSKGSYYTIIHPSGRHWDYNHLFRSYSEIEDYLASHRS